MKNAINRITIIEGPTPDFFSIRHNPHSLGIDTYLRGMLESPALHAVAAITLRCFNGQGLIERCQRAWNENQTMFLDYKDRIGLKQEAIIVAAELEHIEEGDLLHLWVRKPLPTKHYPDLLLDPEDGQQYYLQSGGSDDDIDDKHDDASDEDRSVW